MSFKKKGDKNYFSFGLIPPTSVSLSDSSKSVQTTLLGRGKTGISPYLENKELNDEGKHTTD